MLKIFIDDSTDTVCDTDIEALFKTITITGTDEDNSELLKLKEQIVNCNEDSLLGNGLKREGYEYYNWFNYKGVIY